MPSTCSPGDGEDHRQLALSLRKANLARLLSRHVDGIFLADYEQSEIGHDLFHAACRMGLEGIVPKHRGRAYRGGRCRHLLKVKNRAHPAYSRVADLHWVARR
jgi:ATP-dependent DNA ligase